MKKIARIAALWFMSIGMLSGVLSGVLGADGAGGIEDQTLRYAVSYGTKNINVGVIHIVIANEGDRYVITGVTKPNRLAALFVKAQINDTRFVRRAGNVVLESGVETRIESDGAAEGGQRSFSFDYAGNQIKFSDGSAYLIQPGDQFEAAAFPLLLMLRPLNDIDGMRVREVSTKRAREYEYEKPLEEMVTIPAGTFSSWKINRRRPDKPMDNVTVWLHKAENPLPLKIMIRKRGKTSTLILSSASIAMTENE